MDRLGMETALTIALYSEQNKEPVPPVPVDYGPAILIVNTINLVLIILLIFAGGQVIYKYMVRLGVCKMFVNLFYILALSLLCTDLVLVYAIYFNLEDYDTSINKQGDIYLNIFTLANSLHSCLYVGLVLLQTAAMVQITTGLKIQYHQQLTVQNKAIRNLYLTFATCVLIFVGIAVIEGLSFKILEMT